VLLGVTGIILIVYSSLTDAETNAQVLVMLLQEQFDAGKINDKALRQQVENALGVRRSRWCCHARLGRRRRVDT
jgi:hypothetical protein